MGLSTRQLQDLRLRGIGPQIVQRGLSIHYEQADVQEIERHEAMQLIEQVLASDRPLTLLRALADLAGFNLSPVLQQASRPATLDASRQVPAPSALATTIPLLPIVSSNHTPTTLAVSEGAPSPADFGQASSAALNAATSSAPASETAPLVTPAFLTVIPAETTAWHLVYTKAQQEDIALVNLERQGFTCYLPKLRIEKIRRRKAEVVIEPMFPRYLFVRLDLSGQGKSWTPIRSTLGVQQLIYFGRRAAQVDDQLIDWLRHRERDRPTEAMFNPGDKVIITDGPFADIEAIFQTSDAERRTMILLEILSKPVSMKIDSGRLRKVG
ncbi:MAG: transcription/translation regulatory transformer protein RfaH [Limnohabitans sp.]